MRSKTEKKEKTVKEFFGIGGYTREPEGYLSWQHITFVLIKRTVGYRYVLNVLEVDGVFVFVVCELASVDSDILAEQTVFIEFLSSKLVVNGYRCLCFLVIVELVVSDVIEKALGNKRVLSYGAFAPDDLVGNFDCR